MSFLAFSLVWFLQEPASLNVKELYMNNCALCHGENGDGKGGCMIHHSSYDFNDRILPLGASYWIQLAENILT